MKKNIVTLIILILFTSFANFSWSYNKPVHFLMNQQAITSYDNNGITVWPSQLNSLLQNQIGFLDGIENKIKIGNLNQQIWEWIADGGEFEDSGKRMINHFHDPLKGLDEAGLWDLNFTFPIPPVSSILWGLGLGYQEVDDDWSWEKAKQYYYSYLTGKDNYGNIIANTKEEREACFAKCFRSVGQLMHLLQDASVPMHTRNDAHLFPLFNVNGYLYWGTYETYTESTRDQLDYIPNRIDNHPDPILLEDPHPDQNYAHLAAVTGLFDRNQYNIGDPMPGSSDPVGLAEYTNANFLTQDTMWEYSHPDRSDLINAPDAWLNPEVVDAEDGEKDNRIYFGKTAGEPIERLVAASYWYYQLYIWSKPELIYAYILDEECFADYAAKLVPRAVGYSAELVDYFFRGQMDIKLSEDGLYCVTNISGQKDLILKLAAKNTSLYGGDMISGSIELVIRYEVYGNTYYIDVPEQNGVGSIPSDEFVELSFDLTNNPIPPQASNIFLQVIYTGLLGEGNIDIGVGGLPLSQGMHMDISLPEEGFYSLMGEDEQDFSHIHLRAQNTNPDVDLDDGAIALIVKYRLSEGDPFINDHSDTSWEFSYIVAPEENGETSISKAEPVELSFDVSANPIPLWATDVYLQLVYRDNAAADQETIYTGFKDISEPTPIDIFNNSDKICLFGEWYDTGTAEAIDRVDNPDYGGDGNGIADEWDVYNHVLNDTYYRFWPDWWVGGVTAPDPDAGLYDHHIPLISPGQMHRGPYVLSNYVLYYTYLTSIEPVSSDDPWLHPKQANLQAEYAIKNQIEWSNYYGSYIRYLPGFDVFRGVETWGATLIYPLPYPNLNPEPGSEYYCSFWDLE